MTSDSPTTASHDTGGTSASVSTSTRESSVPSSVLGTVIAMMGLGVGYLAGTVRRLRPTLVAEQSNQDHEHHAAQPPQLPHTEVSIAALAALYQGEKTDASYVFNTAMVMMGLSVAYLVGAIPFVAKITPGPNARLFLALLPMPLWLVALFHSLMTLNAMMHGISVRIIEDELYATAALDSRVDRNLVGSAAGDRIMDITQSHPVHKLTTIIVYTGVALLVIGFTAYALNAALDITGDTAWPRTTVVWVAIMIYVLLLFVVGSSWVTGLLGITKGRDKIPQPHYSIARLVQEGRISAADVARYHERIVKDVPFTDAQREAALAAVRKVTNT